MTHTDSKRAGRVQVLTIVAEIADGGQVHNLSEYFDLDDPHPDLTIRGFSVAEPGTDQL